MISQGLNNLGNTCYINTCIQLLTNIPIFNDIINKKIQFSQYNQKIIDKEIIFQWNDLQKQLITDRNPVSPIGFLNSIHTLAKLKNRVLFTGFSQNDMPEFLQFLIESIHNSIARPVKMVIDGNPSTYKDIIAKDCYNMLKSVYSKEYSELFYLFYGIYVSEIISLNTKQVYSIKSQQFFILDLPIYNGNTIATTLYGCLDIYVNPEILEGENAWLNEKTGVKENIIKQTKFWNFPPILVITLNRFTIDGSRKINSYIDIPIDNFDLSSYVNGYDETDYKYELVGIGNHMGGVNGGHYNAFIKNADNEWLLYDDSNISRVNKIETIISPSAYCLFYKIKNKVL